jgi:hypothetical protein
MTLKNYIVENNTKLYTFFDTLLGNTFKKISDPETQTRKTWTVGNYTTLHYQYKGKSQNFTRIENLVNKKINDPVYVGKELLKISGKELIVSEWSVYRNGIGDDNIIYVTIAINK